MMTELLKAFQKLGWCNDGDLAERVQFQEVFVPRDKNIHPPRYGRLKEDVVLRVTTYADAPARDHKTRLNLQVPCDGLPFARGYVGLKHRSGGDPEEFLNQPRGGHQLEPLITEGIDDGPRDAPP